MFLQCVSDNTNKKASLADKNSYSSYTGSATCINCHKEIYASHIKTAHFNTTTIVNKNNIKGSFQPGQNQFNFPNNNIIKMEAGPDSFFQVAYINGIQKKRQHFDIIFGSGNKAQSYGAWVQNKLVQMPVTYFTRAHQWTNSPGYPDKIVFNRIITSRCMECHSTFAQTLPTVDPLLEEFDRTKIIFGVDCEKCHGPAKEHVEFQASHPGEKSGKYIINPKNFTRQQNIDLCALCHGGRLEKTVPSFSFKAGDKLSNYFLGSSNNNSADIDVHGNQNGLMMSSKCFINSKTLTCNSCHDVHVNEKGKEALFSSRCVQCHDNSKNEASCKLFKTVGNKINDHCIGCHMPKRPSKTIEVLLNGLDRKSVMPAMITTHLVTIYPEETKKMIEYLKAR